MVGTFLEPSCGRRGSPIHSIPYSVAQPLERGSNNYYSIIQGVDCMVTTIQKWGNSHGICIPKSLLESLCMRENDRFELIPSADRFTIKKIKAPQHRTLEERLVEFYGKPVENIASVCNGKEVDWGIYKENEIWVMGLRCRSEKQTL